MKLFSTFFALVALAFSAFSQTSNEVLLTFDHRVGSEKLELNSTVFQIWNGKKMRLDRAQFYLSEIALRQADGSLVELPNRYILVNADGLQKESKLGPWPVAEAVGARLGIGVPDSVNHDDPALWPAGHPLAPQNPSMHWGWAGGYRHMAVEGKVDADGDGVMESFFQWHNVFDPLFRSVEIGTEAISAADGKLSIRLRVDWRALFDGLEMVFDDLEKHGGDPENVKMMDNSADGDFLFWPATVSSASLFEAEKAEILAAPNPFSDQTRLDWRFEKSLPDGLRLELFDGLGRRVGGWDGLPSVGSIEVGEGLKTGLFEAVFFEKTSSRTGFGGQIVGRKRLVRAAAF